MVGRKYTVLFFINDFSPTPQQKAEALNFGPHVTFRNATYVSAEDSSLEPCDAVYGEATPVTYLKAYPWAVSIVDYYNGLLPPKPKQPTVEADDAPPSGAGDVDTFDPFKSAPFTARGAVPN